MCNDVITLTKTELYRQSFHKSTLSFLSPECSLLPFLHPCENRLILSWGRQEKDLHNYTFKFPVF